MAFDYDELGGGESVSRVSVSFSPHQTRTKLIYESLNVGYQPMYAYVCMALKRMLFNAFHLGLFLQTLSVGGPSRAKRRRRRTILSVYSRVVLRNFHSRPLQKRLQFYLSKNFLLSDVDTYTHKASFCCRLLTAEHGNIEGSVFDIVSY